MNSDRLRSITTIPHTMMSVFLSANQNKGSEAIPVKLPNPMNSLVVIPALKKLRYNPCPSGMNRKMPAKRKAGKMKKYADLSRFNLFPKCGYVCREIVQCFLWCFQSHKRFLKRYMLQVSYLQIEWRAVSQITHTVHQGPFDLKLAELV